MESKREHACAKIDRFKKAAKSINPKAWNCLAFKVNKLQSSSQMPLVLQRTPPHAPRCSLSARIVKSPDDCISSSLTEGKAPSFKHPQQLPPAQQHSKVPHLCQTTWAAFCHSKYQWSLCYHHQSLSHYLA